MPYLAVETNISLKPETKDAFMESASQMLSTLLGKPESYIMVDIQSGKHMQFGGNTEPCAYVELKSLGLPEDKTADFSAALCSFINKMLAISPARIYIEFTNPPRHLWGWNNGTF